jgi:MGT family glycosyltransferase
MNKREARLVWPKNVGCPIEMRVSPSILKKTDQIHLGGVFSKMATFAFFNSPAYGHVNPTLAVVKELTMRGQRVVYYLTEEFRSTIEATGAELQPVVIRPFEGIPQSASGKGNMSIGTLPVRLRQMTEQLLPPVLENLRAEPPDFIVYDATSLWAIFASKILNIPAISLRANYAASDTATPMSPQRAHKFPFPMQDFIQSNEALEALSASYGIPPLNVRSMFAHAEPLNIVFLPRIFQPGGELFDESFVFVGPSISEQCDAQNSLFLKKIDGRPLLYISLGTIFNDGWRRFLDMCFSAFRDTEWQVLISLGKNASDVQLQDIPENFLIEDYVPQLEVLQRSRSFITHGGMNSTMEALYFGVPPIVVPQTVEQERTGQQVEKLGLGLQLDKETLTEEVLRNAVKQVTEDETFQPRLLSMQQEIQNAGGYRRAADEILAYAARRR